MSPHGHLGERGADGALVSAEPDGAVPAPERPRSLRETVRAYVALTKPRIIELLLVTTVPPMIVAERGLPSVWLIGATLVGGALAAASANTINCYVDRDIDVHMGRTAKRPLATRAVSPRSALGFGLVLGAVAVAWLAALVNVLAALLALGAILFYVFVYTMGLKRRSPQNIVIGGAAGCMPVLIGWAAVTGEVGLPALVMFAIIYYWTPPHFWALALRYVEDYRAAGVPMLPVVAGEAETTRQIFLYTVVLVSVTLIFGPIGGMGAIYLVASLLLGGGFLALAWSLRRDPAPARAMRVFHYSTTYLALLFTAMAADAIILG